MVKNKNVGKPRNYALKCGVYRFSKSKMYHKKALYKFVDKKTEKKPRTVKPRFIEKKIGGEKNGGTRMVRVRRLKSNFPTVERRLRRPKSKSCFSKHKRSLRASLVPGAVAIVLAGAHKGKRVIVLKQLDTGLLLVTGPHTLNGCPVRRINQIYLIGTSTVIDISKVNIPEEMNDAYFKRDHPVKKGSKSSGDIFESKKETYVVSDKRKADQKIVDDQVLAAIEQHPEKQMLKAYLKAQFSLSKDQYPHNMVF